MTNVTDNFKQLKSKLEQSENSPKKMEDKIIIQIGDATCENAAGALEIKAKFEALLEASGRKDIIIKRTGCTGRCAQEPIVGVFVPGQMPVKYQKVTKDKAAIIFQKNILQKTPAVEFILDKKTANLYDHVVTLCASKGCTNNGSTWRTTFTDRLAQKGVSLEKVKVQEGGCLGFCKEHGVGQHGVMVVYPAKVIYTFKSEAELDEIIVSHFVNNKVADKFTTHLKNEDFFKMYGDVSFFNKQTRITLRNCGIIDPESLEDYVHHSGYQALATVLEKNDQLWTINEVIKAGLRGRGGGGFPTGKKWMLGYESKHDPIKYIVCNADEGDPGAFMDRSTLEGDPFDIIEGMTIAGFAIGAQMGYAYIRAEYPLAIERTQKAIDVARANGLLGKNILGSNFSFDIEIRLGAGAFVCGEETALMLSIEGKRGQPKIRPPYPTTAGLWGHPTVINNVETWANVPAIFTHGSEWFSSIGTEGSKGTKVFALAGKVTNTGLVEVPMGTTLREVIFSIGGGVLEGKEFKAIQTGGPSGGCIPASKLDTAVDYESLKAIGSMMGSGGMIVLDETDCMVSTAKFFLQFTQDESCGKCTPCREGTLRMLEILERITKGEGKIEDLDKLERLGNTIQKSSLCGLGMSAPNPVLSTLKNFREEYLAHIVEKRCPTQKCKDLITYTIESKCVGCTLCARRCPANCISGAPKKLHIIDQEKCIKCGECYNACKFDAISKS